MVYSSGCGCVARGVFPTVGSVWIAEYQAWRLGVARQQLSMGSFVFTAVNGHMVSPCWVPYILIRGFLRGSAVFNEVYLCSIIRSLCCFDYKDSYFLIWIITYNFVILFVINVIYI